MDYALKIVPAFEVDSKDIMNLSKIAAASNAGLYVTSNNNVHKAFLDKAFNNNKYPRLQ